MKTNFKSTITLIFLIIASFYQIFSQENSKLTSFQQEKVEEYLNQVEVYYKEGNLQQSIFYINKVAFLYWDAGSIEIAIQYFLESIPLNEKIQNYEDIKAIYSNIGLMYTDQEKLEEALEFFQKSLSVRRRIGNQEEIASGLLDIAYILGLQKDFDNAIEKVEEALDLSQKINHPQLTLNCFNLLSTYYKDIGNTGKASEYLDMYTSYSMNQETENIREELGSEITKSRADVERGKAEKRANELEFQLNQMRMRAEQDSISLLAAATSDSLKQSEKTGLERQIEIELLQANKEKNEAQLKEEKAVQARQRIMLFSAGGILLFVAFMSMLLYRSGRARLKINQQLEIRNKEIEDQRDKIKKQNEDISKSINYAQGIQKALLPPQLELANYIPDSFVFFKPRDVVSGDYYWFNDIVPINGEDFEKEDGIKLVSNKFAVSAIDCTGHGVPGAFMSMIGYNLLDEIISSGTIKANEILEKLHLGVRKALRQGETDNHDGMDMALCVIDRKEKLVEFSGAKNPMIYIQDGELVRVKGDKNPIGGMQTEPVRKFTSHTLKIDKPTWIYLFSDGFPDQFGGKDGRKFMSKRFYELLLEIHQDPMCDQRQLIKETLINWKGDYKQIDDVLVIGFKLEL